MTCNNFICSLHFKFIKFLSVYLKNELFLINFANSNVSERRIFAMLFLHDQLMTSMHESSRYIVVTTSLLVGEATKPLDIENTLCITSEARRRDEKHIVANRLLAPSREGVFCGVCSLLDRYYLCFFFLFCFFPLSLSLSLSFSLFLSLLLAFLFLFLSTLAFSSFFLTVHSSTWMSPDVSKT